LVIDSRVVSTKTIPHFEVCVHITKLLMQLFNQRTYLQYSELQCFTHTHHRL